MRPCVNHTRYLTYQQEPVVTGSFFCPSLALPAKGAAPGLWAGKVRITSSQANSLREQAQPKQRH